MAKRPVAPRHHPSPWPAQAPALAGDAIPETPSAPRIIRLDPTESDSIRLAQAILKHFFIPFQACSGFAWERWRLLSGVPPSGGQRFVDQVGRVNAGLQTWHCQDARACPCPSQANGLISLGNSAGGCILTGEMKFLTRQEQFVLCLILLLVLTGWAVKAYRTAHPPTAPIAQSES